jgi:hypothetical protein
VANHPTNPSTGAANPVAPTLPQRTRISASFPLPKQEACRLHDLARWRILAGPAGSAEAFCHGSVGATSRLDRLSRTMR